MPAGTAEPQRKRAKKHVIIPAVCIGLIAVLAIAFFAYTGVYSRAEDSVWDVAAACDVRIAQQDGYIECVPAHGAPAAGYVFYPGGKVEAAAYLPYLAAVAEQ